MQDEKKTSFFKKIFGQKSSCCSLELEEVDSKKETFSGAKDTAANCCCCSPPNTDVKKDDDVSK